MTTSEVLIALGLIIGWVVVGIVILILAVLILASIGVGIGNLIKWYKHRPEEVATSIEVEPITYERAWDKKQRRKRVNKKRKQAAKARRGR